MANLLKEAIAYSQGGLSVIPTNGGKHPALPEWTPFQKQIADEATIKSWKINSLAVIAGQVSGGLEFLDFDYLNVSTQFFDQWTQEVEEIQPGLIGKLFMERSPHGVHFAYRGRETRVPGNMTLARRIVEVPGPGEHIYGHKKHTAKKRGAKWFIMPSHVETRGEGGYCIVSPSPGYEAKQGNLLELPVISRDEREILIEAARALNEAVPEPTPKTHHQGAERLPGQDFDDRGDIRGLLEKHGWSFKGNGSTGRERWARPGKTKGHSATLTDGKVFYVFSSNATPFESEKAYGPFGVYAIIEHGGDFKEATKALAKEGYGSRPNKKTSAGRKPKFLNVGAMEKEFKATSKMLYRDDLFPGGEPSLIGGMPGVGKSTDMGAMCKEIVLKNPNYYIMWVATEGFVSDHADKWRKLNMPDQVVMLSDNRGVYKLQLDNRKDRDFLDQSIQELKEQTGGNVVAVVIDSLRGSQAMGENDPKIASMMSAINSIVCDKHKAACIYIAHHKKGKEAIRMNKVAGGTGITSSVRAVYSVERVSEYICRIIPDKSNTLGHRPKTYKSVLIQGDDGWEIAITEDTAQEDKTQKGKAEQFLISLFRKSEEWESREIYRLGAFENLSSDTLKKVKKNLPIENIHETPKSPWIWRCSLYKQNLSPCTNSIKTEPKKPNKINQGEQGEQNLKKTPENATGGTEGTGRTGGLENKNNPPVEIINNNKRLHCLENTNFEYIRPVDDIPPEGIPF